MDSVDVLVVGAGLAGLNTARWLAERGRRVMLVDRKPRLDQSIHTTGIFVRRTLEDFELPEDCLGPVVRDVRLYSPRRRTMELSSPHDEFRVGKMGRLYLRTLEAAIGAGVDWRPNCLFVGSREHAHGSLVDLEIAGTRQTVEARFLVGADGANSRVARDLQLSQNRHWIVGVEEVYASRTTDESPCLHCFLDPRIAPGYIAWIADDGEEIHLGVGGYANRFEPHAALARLREEAGRYVSLPDAEPLERRGGRIPVGGVLRRIVNRRGLLVGDAAGAVSPLTAGGLDPCLRQAALAAEVADAYLGDARETHLAPYQGVPFRRRFLVRRILRWGLAEVRQPWMAEAAFRLLQLPPLDELTRRVFFGRGSFPLEITAPASSPTATG
ncbi:MAG: NAD(P)/FAD-dependent oxidoreductase [Pirellulaceae bacterium]